MTTETYAVELTGEQVFRFAAVVHRLRQAYGADQERPLRHDIVAELDAFEALLPEPSEADGDAYLAAVASGLLPNWNGDTRPVTEPHDEYVAALLTRAAKPATGPVAGRDVLLSAMGTGNVHDDDEESLQFADESEWMDAEDDDDEDAPDVKVWSRKLSTGVETYRMVPAAELDAYLAGIDADPDREVIEG